MGLGWATDESEPDLWNTAFSAIQNKILHNGNILIQKFVYF
jgi:hypothetical protein